MLVSSSIDSFRLPIRPVLAPPSCSSRLVGWFYPRVADSGESDSTLGREGLDSWCGCARRNLIKEERERKIQAGRGLQREHCFLVVVARIAVGGG